MPSRGVPIQIERFDGIQKYHNGNQSCAGKRNFAARLFAFGRLKSSPKC